MPSAPAKPRRRKPVPAGKLAMAHYRDAGLSTSTSQSIRSGNISSPTHPPNLPMNNFTVCRQASLEKSAGEAPRLLLQAVTNLFAFPPAGSVVSLAGVRLAVADAPPELTYRDVAGVNGRTTCEVDVRVPLVEVVPTTPSNLEVKTDEWRTEAAVASLPKEQVGPAPMPTVTPNPKPAPKKTAKKATTKSKRRRK